MIRSRRQERIDTGHLALLAGSTSATTHTIRNSAASTLFLPLSRTLRKKPRLHIIAEELDAHRKRVLGEHPHLTLPVLYMLWRACGKALSRGVRTE